MTKIDPKKDNEPLPFDPEDPAEKLKFKRLEESKRLEKEKYFIYTVINALNPGKIKIDNTIPNIHKYEEDNKVLLKINSYQVYFNK